jgi:O-acetyl-ADP-ribose deacetylase (regulator of RNase III)
VASEKEHEKSAASSVSSKITFVKGNLLDSKAQTLVNTVNCVGVMGKGIAKDFKKKYPAMFKDYQQRCKNHQIELGKPYLYRMLDKQIVNFPTKGDWRNPSDLDQIKTGLKYLAEHAAAWGITSLALPHLGCGNGGLNWEDVWPLVEKHLGPLGISIEIYAPPAPTAAHQVKEEKKRAASTGGIKRKGSTPEPGKNEKKAKDQRSSVDFWSNNKGHQGGDPQPESVGPKSATQPTDTEKVKAEDEELSDSDQQANKFSESNFHKG